MAEQEQQSISIMSTDDDDDTSSWLEPKPRHTRTRRQPVPIVCRGRAESVVHVARAERRIDDPHPEPHSPKLTGRYQDKNALVGDGSGVQHLLHLNRAGRYIRGTLVTIPAITVGKATPPDLKIVEFETPLGFKQVSPTVFPIETVNEEKKDVKGQITEEDDDLWVDFPPLDHVAFFRREKWPSLFDKANRPLFEVQGVVAGAGLAKELVTLGELVPLTDTQKERIWRMLSADKFRAILQEYFSLGMSSQSSEQGNRGSTVDKLNDMIRNAVGHDYANAALDPIALQNYRRIFTHRQQPLADNFARLVLAHDHSTFNGVEASHLDWFEILLADISTDQGVAPSMSEGRRIAHLPAASGGPATKSYPYTFEFDLKAYDADSLGKKLSKLKIPLVEKILKKLNEFNVGGLYGDIKISMPGAGGNGSTTVAYKAFVAGAGYSTPMGDGHIGDIKQKVSPVVHSRWTPKDFPGTLEVDAGMLYAYMKPSNIVKKVIKGQKDISEGAKKIADKILDHTPESIDKPVGKASASVVFKFHGSGLHPWLHVDVPMPLPEGAGGELRISFGRVWSEDPALQEIEHATTHFETWANLTASSADESNTHFAFGSAVLLEDDRRDVRKFCATWLRWLKDPFTSLEIVGHTDTVDCEDRNQQLSEMRAKNVLQAIRDILGKDFAIPEDRIKVRGMGEKDAVDSRGRPLPDNRKSTAARRVDVLLNGHIVLTLWSVSDPGEPNGTTTVPGA